MRGRLTLNDGQASLILAIWLSEGKIKFLGELTEARLMFKEDGQYLSLALPACQRLAVHPGGPEGTDPALVTGTLDREEAPPRT